MARGPLRRLTLNSLGNARRTLATLAREVHRADGDEIDFQKHRLLIDYLKLVLQFWKVELDTDIEKRLDEMEAKLDQMNGARR
jgi:hypothetical protein